MSEWFFTPSNKYVSDRGIWEKRYSETIISNIFSDSIPDEWYQRASELKIWDNGNLIYHELIYDTFTEDFTNLMNMCNDFVATYMFQKVLETI